MMSENEASEEAVELWRHPQPESTQIYAFKSHVSKKYQVQLPSFHELWSWSVENPASFWEEIWQWTGIYSTKKYTSVLETDSAMFPKPAFFPGCELNFAENLLYPASNPAGDSPAIIAATETTRETITWDELRERVRVLKESMDSHGLKKGQRVAGYVANHANTVIAMLAATSIGAIWTGVSPDTGVHAVLDRLKQVEPVLLFVDNAVAYNGKTHETHAKVSQVAKELSSVKNIVIFETLPDHPFDVAALEAHEGTAVKTYKEFISSNKKAVLSFTALPPEHPVYILYSSGTTGAPKPIVHSSLGTLLQHKKEHTLQCDIRSGERLFYFTTCTWMMWHWLVSGLASGATIVMYDGSPFQPHKEQSMPLLIDELKINHFGTSAKYLSVLEQANLVPSKAKHAASLDSLKAIYSTGSPLAPSTFQYVYKSLKPDIMLGSITGGTDILSLFASGCPILPVHAGEIQAPGLGMNIRCYSADGKDITSTGEAGELVCITPFPCQPCMFWPPGDKGEERYRSSYFEVFKNDRGQPIWHHGDFVRFNPKTMGIWMLGRSDGVLNPMGVRFGSSELYNLMLKHFSAEVEDSLCIGRKRKDDIDEVVVMFLLMSSGHKLTPELIEKIQGTVRRELSARHVPKVITECPEIPVTTNGKKVEGAVKKILCGINVATSASVANSDCLQWYREWAKNN